MKDIFAILNRHKFKFIVSALSTVLFLVYLFPFGDLSDLVTTQVAQRTQNQVYLQFDTMELSLFDGFGLSLQKVSVESPQISALTAEQLTVSPHLPSLIAQKPGGSLSAQGLWGGEITAKLSAGDTSEKGTQRHRILIEASQLSLEQVARFAKIPVPLKGKISLTTDALADLTVIEQPEVELEIKINDFVLPPTNIQTPLDAISLSGFKLKEVSLKGRLADGLFIIEQSKIGQTGDEIQGSVKGRIGLQLRNNGGRISPIVGGYNFEVDLTIQKSFQEREKLLLFLVDQHKKPAGPSADRFALKISSNNPSLPPAISALQ
jgi:type II secretion system protein N